MLKAQDFCAAMSWTKRQLGQASSRAAVVEVKHDAPIDWVEKSGTGIRESNCGAFLSIMADSIQRVAGSNHNEMGYEDGFRRFNLKSLAPVMH